MVAPQGSLSSDTTFIVCQDRHSLSFTIPSSKKKEPLRDARGRFIGPITIDLGSASEPPSTSGSADSSRRVWSQEEKDAAQLRINLRKAELAKLSIKQEHVEEQLYPSRPSSALSGLSVADNAQLLQQTPVLPSVETPSSAVFPVSLGAPVTRYSTPFDQNSPLAPVPEQLTPVQTMPPTSTPPAPTLQDLLNLLNAQSAEIAEIKSAQLQNPQGSSHRGQQSTTDYVAKHRRYLDDLESGHLSLEDVKKLYSEPSQMSSRDEGIRVKDIGYLDPQYPEKFIRLLELQKDAGVSQEKIIRMLQQSMINNDERSVRDWYSTTISISIHDSVQSVVLRSLDGWIAMIRQKFGKTLFQKAATLDKLRWNWDRDVAENVTSVLQACVECDVLSAAEQIVQIVKRLPEEYTYGLDIEQYTSVAGLEKSLKGRHMFAVRSHRENMRRNLDGRDSKRSASSSPERLRNSDNFRREGSESRGDRRASPAPPRSPCNDCGTYHWKTGPFAAACPPEARKKFQGNREYAKKEEVHVITDDEDGQGYWSESESQDANEDTQREDFYDSEAYLVDFSNHGKLIDFDTRSYTGVYITTAPGQSPSRKSNKVIRAKALGPLAGQHSYKHYTNQQILVRTGGAEGQPKWRPADTCSPMNFVSQQYLDKHHTDVPRSAKDSDHQDIGGVVKGPSVKSTEGCWLKLYLPMTNGDDVLVEGYFHILQEFSPGLLFGQDMNVPYGFHFDSDKEKFYVRGAGNAEGRLLVRRESRGSKNPVKMSHSMVVKAGNVCHIPVNFKPFKGEDMIFTGKSFANSAIGEEGKAHGHLVSESTNQVRFSNLGNRPIKLKKGCVIGWVEVAPASPICLFTHGIEGLASGISNNTAPNIFWSSDWGVTSKILSKLPNPWREESQGNATAYFIENAKVNSGKRCCNSKYPFAPRILQARECEKERALDL